MNKINWVLIFGSAEVSGHTIRHSGAKQAPFAVSPPSATGVPPPVPHALLRSNMNFEQGSISWQAKLMNADSRVQLLLPVEPLGANANQVTAEAIQNDLAVGLNVLGAPYGFAVWTGKWEAAGGVGDGAA